jgi:O-acetyl-ADP-ribose deacetylase (regulator of RNase III)
MSTINTPSVALQGVEILFLDFDEKVVLAWDRALERYAPQRLRPQLRTRHCALEKLDGDDMIFDCIVSPANSYGRLDGRYVGKYLCAQAESLINNISFDFYLSEALAPPNNFDAPTRHVQAALYRQYRGFAPPGTCTLVSIAGTRFDASVNKHKCNFIAVCPTMRTPTDVRWDKEVVYECTWTFLNVIDNHNANCAEGEKIRKVLCPGLATGIGRVSAEKCAVQMTLAINHYDKAVSNPMKWSALEWEDIAETVDEMDETYGL